METYLSSRAKKATMDVDRSLIVAIAKRTNGNPLRLRLAADLMVREADTLRTAAGRRKFLLR